MSKPSGGRYLVEDFTPVHLDDLRRAAGGRKRLRALDSCLVRLPGGEEVEVSLTRRQANLGGEFALMLCPACNRACCVLRMIPGGLVCVECLRARYSVKYRSQVRPPMRGKLRLPPQCQLYFPIALPR